MVTVDVRITTLTVNDIVRSKGHDSVGVASHVVGGLSSKSPVEVNGVMFRDCLEIHRMIIF